MHRGQLKLHPKKCVFMVHKEKVLGCLASVKGIETNTDKIKAIMHMKPPESRKDVQKLTGRIATLNRFTSKLAEQSIPTDRAVLGWHGTGPLRARAIFIEPQLGPTSTTGCAVPPDGLAARPRHGTQLVKWVVPGLMACRPYRAGLGPTRIKFKRMYFC
jgi:hypothetical protein